MSESSGFGKFVPGFDFLQNLAGQAASGVAQGISQNMPQLPNLSHWVAPTFNVDELEKRIEELKAVHYWLDQNAKALGATIQALEVQKMTLATLEHMNFSMGDVANAFKLKAADSAANLGVTPPRQPTRQYSFKLDPAEGQLPETEPEKEREEEVEAKSAKRRASRAGSSQKKQSSKAHTAPNMVDPMQWWGGLTQQFQSIAANAMKDAARNAALDTTRGVATDVTGKAMKTATDMAGKVAGTMMGTAGAMAGMGKAAMGAAPRKGAASSTKTTKAAKTASKALSSQAKKRSSPAAGAGARKATPTKKASPRQAPTARKRSRR